MRIAHVSPYDHQVAGGVREHVVNLAAQHEAMGHEVTIIAPASHRRGLAGNVVCASTAVVPIPGSGSVVRVSVSPLVFGRIPWILRTGRFDVVHMHEPLLPAVGLFTLYHAPRLVPVTVGTIHGFREELRALDFLKWPLRPLMDRLSARIAVSTDAERWMAQYFPGEYNIIPDGVDVDRFADPEVKPIPELDDGRPNVLFVGRMEPRKGFRHLLDAFPAVQRAVPDARLVAVGDYDEAARRHWAQEAAERGVRDVELVGFVSAEDLPRYYRTASVFCAPSTGYEALGIVLLEAMASGTPVVTTDIEGYRTVVTHERSALVAPPEDPAALAHQITRVLQEPALRDRLVEGGRQRVQDYAWPTLARRITELYESCR